MKSITFVIFMAAIGEGYNVQPADPSDYESWL